ncbi:MAG: hypothetical protein JWR19_128 [Pedosphaera sp.]|nr:hypothetical protein [Pedosphaera sp.]
MSTHLINAVIARWGVVSTDEISSVETAPYRDSLRLSGGN